MHWGLIVAGIALMGCGSMLGCSTNAAVIIGETPLEKLNFVAKRNPNFAFGLGYAKGATPPIIQVTGMTEKGGTIRVPSDARWHIGSISKSFTSALILRLVERGKLDLDAPISVYLSAYEVDLHPQWRAVTLRQLLSHTSGAQANASNSELAASMEYDSYVGRRTIMANIWNKPLAGTPGEFEYSNIGYTVAGMVAEEVMDATWEDLIRSEIAGPLGLTSLGFGAPKGDTDPRGHVSMFGYSRAVDPNSTDADNPAWMGPSGIIHLSLADLVKWGQTHLRACQGGLPEFLSQQSCMTLREPIGEDYGLGWVIDSEAPNGPTIWHNGSNLRWYAMLYLDPSRNTSVAVVTNSPHGEPVEALAKAVSQSY